MAMKLQRVEEQVQRARSEAAQKYQNSTTTAMLRQDSTESVALHDRKVFDEQAAANVLNTIVASCLSRNTQFLDTDFPCTPTSLHGTAAVRRWETKDGHQGVAGATDWGRAMTVKKNVGNVVGVGSKEQWVVFRSENPSAEDLMQGGLGGELLLNPYSRTLVRN